MSDIAAPMPGQASPKPNLDTKVAPVTAIIFILLLAGGLLFTVYGVYSDIQAIRRSRHNICCRSCSWASPS